MKSFSLMVKAQRETAAVTVVALTIVFLLVASIVLTNVMNNRLYLHAAFYVGVVVFGLIGFLALDILASLSFLGIGIKPPGAAWGAMVNDGYTYLMNNPVLSFAPGLAIMLVVFAFNMVGDGLRDALDPRLRGLI